MWESYTALYNKRYNEELLQQLSHAKWTTRRQTRRTRLTEKTEDEEENVDNEDDNDENDEEEDEKNKDDEDEENDDEEDEEDTIHFLRPRDPTFAFRRKRNPNRSLQLARKNAIHLLHRCAARAEPPCIAEGLRVAPTCHVRKNKAHGS